MKSAVSYAVVLGLVLTSGALAHDSGPASTMANAERIVMRSATVRLPASARAAFEDELLALIPRYRTLEQWAWVEGDQHAAARFHNFRYRLSTALTSVRDGLRIAAVECAGAGAAVEGNRFAHFRCAVRSVKLEIPSAELLYTDEGALPELIKREPRTFGPSDALLFVHITGRSAIAYRQVG